MSQDNQITLRGYLTAEPRFYQKTPMAPPVAEIRVGSTPRRLNRETGEWQDAPTSYYTVKAWRRLAVNAVSSLHKGDMVIVRGKFYMRNWVDSEQRPRAALEIEADTLGHDLAYGWAHFLRGSQRQAEARAAEADGGETARQDVQSPDAADVTVTDSDRAEEYPPDDTLEEPAGTALAPGGLAGLGDELTASGISADSVEPASSTATADAGLPEAEAVPL
jgi:single-strand DNA-binding protein